MTQRPGPGRSSSRGGAPAPRPAPRRTTAARTTASRPQRRPPRRVFWVRRLLALVVVAIVVLVVVLVVRLLLPDSSSASTGTGAAVGRPVVAGTTPTVTPRTTPTPTPTPTASGVVGTCGASDVAATATPAAGEFAWGAKVSFTVTIRDVGPGPCVVDGSNKARAVVVSSGGKVVWSSATCTTGQRLLLLGPGDVDTQKVTWDRTRTATQCGHHGSAAGAGSYEVATTVLGTASDPVAFTLAPKNPPSPGPTSDATGASSPGPTSNASSQPTTEPGATTKPAATAKPSAAPTGSATPHPGASHAAKD